MENFDLQASKVRNAIYDVQEALANTPNPEPLSVALTESLETIGEAVIALSREGGDMQSIAKKTARETLDEQIRGINL